MANQEHLSKLKGGVGVWNQWREKHRDIRPNLSRAYRGDVEPSNTGPYGLGPYGADLHNANLSNANLREADLSEADLSGADLRGADLREADLRSADLHNANLHDASLYEANLQRANLQRANLREANLIGTDLNKADLRGADLRDADLSDADLSSATLNGADLRSAILWDTVLSNVDLRTTKGLLEIQHGGPSRVELYSVQLPQDGSALHFLREVGVPDEWIDFYKATMQQPIQYHSCFISYSSEDYDIAKRFHADLQDQGVRCWFAPHDLVPGDHFREKIDLAIHMQDKLLLILSTHSMKSAWVQHEVRKALNREIHLE